MDPPTRRLRRREADAARHQTATSWAGHLCHPLPLAAVLVLAVNDHVLKGSGLLPDMVTGKLSGQMAFMSGKLKLKGDMGLAMKIGSMFQV